MSESIDIKSPTRVDLAGGTLDLWPLHLFTRGAVTVNVAIDVWTRAQIIPYSDSRIEVESKDIGLKKEFKNLQAFMDDTDKELILLQAQVRYWQPERGFRLETSSQSPIGGGLGGSSSLTVSLLKAFEIFCNPQKNKMNSHQMTFAAHNIEAEILNTPTGTQDYYPAISGGINILNYGYDGIQQEILPVHGSALQDNFLLVYTGKAHHSGLNNFEVLKAAVGKEKKVMDALFVLKQVAIETADTCRRKNWSELPALFRREYEARIQLAPAFSCPEIEELYELSLRHGAQAVKICGAGGGGCVLVWVDKASRERVSSECQKAGFKVMNANPVDPL